jgi:glucose-6-phosphate 1-dehydrogenase
MLVFRFANPAFEPIWNNDFIDHVQITVAEDIGIGSRASFYEKTGVVRDMIQNHLLQLLCMTALEPPVAYDAQSLRDETVKVLRAIRPPAPEDCVRGQYGAGVLNGGEVDAYRDEDGVADSSETATYAAIRVTIDNWRFAGVPFYLRTGKRLQQKLTEVAVFFKPTPHMMFPLEEDRPTQHNVLAFRLQPEEGILQTFVAKQPGPDICLRPVTSQFLYADAFGVRSPPRAYAWLILDVMEGQQTLFAREDWVDRAWSIVDPVVERWESEPPPDFPNYRAGSWGPEGAAELLRRDGRAWRQL